MKIEINNEFVKEMKRYCKKNGTELTNKDGIEKVINEWLDTHLQVLIDTKAINSRDGEVAILEDNEYNIGDDEDDIKELVFER